MTTPQQLKASEIDLKLAPSQFCERLCLVKKSPNTNFAFTPGREGPDVSMNQLWPALKFNTHKELMDQLKIDDVKSVCRIKAKVTVAANKLARNAGIPLTSAGFAFLLGKGCDNFLVLLKKNDINGDLVEKGMIFDFFDHIHEMESGTGYCSSTEFQHAFKIAMARMEEDVDEAADDLVNMGMGGVVTSAKKTVHTEQEQVKPVQPIHEQVENPIVPSPNGKAGNVPVETVEFKVANASDTSTFGNDGEASEPRTPVSDKATAEKAMDWAELWDKLKEKGWGHKSGDNLVDWYWVQPEYVGLGKREMLERGTLGKDYFIDHESVMRYAKTHLGLRVMVETPGSDNNEKKDGVHQRRGRKRSAAAAITVEPTVEKKKKEEEKKKSGKKKKPVESPMSEGSRFSMGGQLSVDQSVTMSEAEMNIGVSKKKQDSARKNVTYVKTYNEQDADDERENPEIDNDGESKNTEDEIESKDETFEVMGSHEAWRMLMAHFEFKFHQGKYYCLPGKENKPGDNSSAIEGRHYFSSLMDLRKHLCAFGFPECKLFMSKSDSDALDRWVRYTNFTGLSASGSTYINPTDFGELLSFREVWAMLLQLGLRYTGGYYIVDDPDPSKEPKKFERPEQMLVHLARFGIPNTQGVSHAGLDDNDRLRLDLYIAGTEINSYKRIDPDKENINEITPRRSRSKRSSDAAVELSNEQNLPKQSSPEPKQALKHREYQMSFNALEAQRQIDLRQVDSETSFELLTEHYNFCQSTSYESTSADYGDTYYCFPGVNLTDEFKLGVHFFKNMQDLRKYLCAYGLPPRTKRVKKQPSEGDLELLEQWIRSAHIQEPYDESAIISEKMKPKEVKRILKELGYEFNKKHNFYLLPGVSSHESHVGKDRFENLIDLFNHIARFGLSSREGSLDASVDLQRLQLFIASVATNDISQRIECSEPLPKQAPSASKGPAVATKQSEYEHNASGMSVETPKQASVPVVLDQEDTPEPKETPPPKRNPSILKFLSKTVTSVADGVSSVVKGARTPHSVDYQLSKNDAQKDDMNRSLQHSDSDEVFESISTSLPVETEGDAMGDCSEASAQPDEKKEKVEYSLSSDQINMPWVELWKEMKSQGWRHTTGDLRVSYFYINSTCAGMKKKEVLTRTKGIDYFESEEEIQAYAKEYLGWKGVKEFSTPGEAHFSSPEDSARHSENNVASGDSLSRSQANMPWKELWKEMRAQGWRHTNGDGLVSYIYINSKCAGMKKADVLKGTKGIDYFESEEEIQAYAKKYLGWKGVKEFSTPGEAYFSSTDSVPTTKRKEVPASALPDSKKSRIEKNTQVTTTPKKPHAVRRNKAPSSAGSKESSSSLKSVASEDSHIPVPDLQLTYKDKLEYCKLTLHPSYAPKKERLSKTSNSKVQELENEIKTFMMRAMQTNYMIDGMTAQSPGFLYICGGPGTGKTTAVTACSQQLSKWAKDGGFAKPCYCHINMASNAPMNGDGVMKHMLKTMAKKLQIDKNSNLPTFKKQIEKKGVILVIDEIDMLFKNGGGSGEGWFTTLIEWSEDKDLAFSMIGISNSVNDGSATKIRDLGHCPHELVFPTYNDADLLAILEKRIGKKIVDNKALQLISKRVAASTGDARKALEITSNAIDKALDAIGEETMRKKVEDDGVYPLVKLPHMMRAIREGMPTRHEEIIRGLPQAQKVILCIAVSLGKVWGPTASVSIADLKKFAVQATQHAVLDGAHLGQITNIVETLMDSGLLTTDHDGCSNFNPNDPSSRLHIGVQLDDVEIALEKSLLGDGGFYRSLVDYVKRECPQPSMS